MPLKNWILLRGVLVIAILSLSNCGAKVTTGRNADPANWQNSTDNGNESGSENPSNNSPSASSDPNTGLSNGANSANQSCFKTESQSLSPALQKVCDETIKTNPLLTKINEYLCTKRLLVSALSQPSCGWHGDPDLIMRNVNTYEREPASSGKDYEDVHATMSNPPVTSAVYLNFVRLAFENYPEFKRQGFQWISGTRENTNLNQGTLETGVDYKFRVDREAYELGYSAHIKLIQLDDKNWIHINYADSDFVRVRKFAQIVLYREQSNGSLMVVKLEHKGVDSSGGLYNRAWQGAIELLKDFMNKSWSNVVRGAK